LRQYDNKHVIHSRSTKLKLGEDIIAHLDGRIGKMTGDGELRGKPCDLNFVGFLGAAHGHVDIAGARVTVQTKVKRRSLTDFVKKSCITRYGGAGKSEVSRIIVSVFLLFLIWPSNSTISGSCQKFFMSWTPSVLEEIGSMWLTINLTTPR